MRLRPKPPALRFAGPAIPVSYSRAAEIALDQLEPGAERQIRTLVETTAMAPAPTIQASARIAGLDHTYIKPVGEYRIVFECDGVSLDVLDIQRSPKARRSAFRGSLGSRSQRQRVWP